MNSVWLQETDISKFKSLDHDITTDVLIIGGGMTGVLCAHRLAQEHVDYVLIEADRIGHGISGNTTAKITSQHGLLYHKLLDKFDAETARLYFHAHEAAIRSYREMAQSVSCDFEEKDNYIFSCSSKRELEQEMSALSRLGIPAEYTEATELPFSVSGAICFRNQAQFHPLKFLSRIAEGLNIYEHTAAREYDGNSVLTDGGKITASKIIVATHFPMFNKHGGYFLKMYQERSYVLALENAQQVDGMYLDASKDGLSFRNYGELLLLGGGSYRTGKQGSGWRELERFAAQQYPNASVKYRWATQDCMTLDGMAYIGQYSRRTPNLFVATGFNKWGMTSSMVAAMILRDLVQGKENPYASVFSPLRSLLRPQLLANVFETSKNLLTPTRPRCPHLGCALKWNPQEHSWDCPCHGSRFSGEGKLMDNPATSDLSKKPIKDH